MSPSWVFAHGISAALLHSKEHIFSLRSVTRSFITYTNELILTWLRRAFVSVPIGGKTPLHTLRGDRDEINNGSRVARKGNISSLKKKKKEKAHNISKWQTTKRISLLIMSRKPSAWDHEFMQICYYCKLASKDPDHATLAHMLNFMHMSSLINAKDLVVHKAEQMHECL